MGVEPGPRPKMPPKRGPQKVPKQWPHIENTPKFPQIPGFLFYRRLASKGNVGGEGPGDIETFFISNRSVSQENLYRKGKNDFVNSKNEF